MRVCRMYALAIDTRDGEMLRSVFAPDATVSGAACRAYTRFDYRTAGGTTRLQRYSVTGMGHAWPGGSSAGTYTDPCAPDASTLILNFFGF